MKTSCFDKLEELTPRYLSIFNQAEHISFDLSYPWFVNLASTALMPGEYVKVCVAEDDDGNIVILPMCCEEGNYGARNIRALVNFYTSSFAPIASTVVTTDLLSEALSALKKDNPHWDYMDFKPLTYNADLFSSLSRALRMIGFIPYKYFCFGNWYFRVSGRSYSDYLNSLPTRLKNTIKRKKKQFFANGAGRLEIITSSDRVEHGIAAYEKVYATSWKNQEPFPRFISGLIRISAEQGWLRLGIAYIDDAPVSVQLWIVSHGRAAIYKLAYDERYASHSVGSILTAHLMEYVIDVDKVLEVDYLSGDDSYKKDWMSNRREKWGIVAYNPSTVSGLMGAVKQSLGWVRRMVLSTFNTTINSSFNKNTN